MPAPSRQLMGATEWALLLTLSVVWGGSFFFAEVVVADLPPLTVVLGRVGLAAVALNLLVLLSGRRLRRPGAAWLPFLAMGALNNVIPFALIVWGQTRIGGLLAERLEVRQLLGMALIFACLAAIDGRPLTGLRRRLAGGPHPVGTAPPTPDHDAAI